MPRLRRRIASRDPVNVLLRSARRDRSGEGCFVRFDGDRPNGMVKDVVIGLRHVVALWDWQSTNRTALPKSR